MLVCDAHDPALVYPFSFGDLESAMQFLRNEVARGLDMRLAAIYHGVVMSIRSQGDEVALMPEMPTLAPLGGQRPPEAVSPLLGEATAVPPEPPSLPDDAVDQMLCVLRTKRWEALPDPFQGFGSPPGRF